MRHTMLQKLLFSEREITLLCKDCLTCIHPKLLDEERLSLHFVFKKSRLVLPPELFNGLTLGIFVKVHFKFFLLQNFPVLAH